MKLWRLVMNIGLFLVYMIVDEIVLDYEGQWSQPRPYIGTISRMVGVLTVVLAGAAFCWWIWLVFPMTNTVLAYVALCAILSMAWIMSQIIGAAMAVITIKVNDFVVHRKEQTK